MQQSLNNNSQTENIEKMEGDALEKSTQDLNVSTEEGTGPFGMYILLKIYIVWPRLSKIQK